ncbi:MAG: alpha/beta hydrolase [Pseudomonadota bacterium]
MSWLVWCGLGPLLLAAALAPFFREALRPKLSDKERQGASGQFAQLQDGLTYFEWRGPAQGHVIVLVHGLTTPSFVWLSIAEALAADGYRVLRYDLFGRGLSDRPKGLQDRDFFVGQLTELLAREGVGQDITIIGYSMGGAIATAFASMHPARVRQLVLIAPAGMQKLSGGLVRLVRVLPGVGDWLMHTAYPGILRRGLDAERDLETSVPGINDLQRAELTRRGFLPAVLSSLRGILATRLSTDHRLIAKWEIPVLAIWGSDDDVISLNAKDQLAEWNHEADQVVVPNAGHGLPYTHTDEVLAHIRKWLI